MTQVEIGFWLTFTRTEQPLKILIIAFLALSPFIARGDSQQFTVSVALTTHDVPVYLSLLNGQLDLKLPVRTLSDYSASIAPSNEFSEGIDVHYRGVVRTVTYRIAKSEIGEVTFSFVSGNKELASAICEQAHSYSKVIVSARALTNCRTDLLESVET
tara:strand:+ start:964 stop:1437 length:474 start_codon:yes stop_codon:yes gene_type:complete